MARRGKGKKAQYMVKWKGHKLKTYEPRDHLLKYGALNDVPLKGRSKKQPKTSISSAQAEVYALSDIIGEAKHIAHKMDDINSNVKWPITIGVDNEQAKNSAMM